MPAPTLENMMMHLPFRIISRIDIRPNGCWIWTGSRNPKGYPQVRRNQKTLMLHRLLYAEMIGPIPPGLVLDHLCRTPSCVNVVEHVEPVTNAVNIKRGLDFRGYSPVKTHCPSGHSYAGDNVYSYIVKKSGTPARSCRQCGRDASRRYAERQRA